MEISDKAALADTNFIVSEHCHSPFRISQSCTSCSGARLIEISCDIKFVYTQLTALGALSYSGYAQAYKIVSLFTKAVIVHSLASNSRSIGHWYSLWSTVP